MAYRYNDPTANEAIANIIREENRKERERNKVKKVRKKKYMPERIRVC